MGRFVHLVKQYQLRCGNTDNGYWFEERLELREILNVSIMDSEVSFCTRLIFSMLTYPYEDATVANLPSARRRRIQRPTPPPTHYVA